MNAPKHMEVIFGVGLALACVLAFLPGDRVHPAASDAARGGIRAAGVPVVVVTGKRMTELEKRQSAEAGATSARPAAAGS